MSLTAAQAQLFVSIVEGCRGQQELRIKPIASHIPARHRTWSADRAATSYASRPTARVVTFAKNVLTSSPCCSDGPSSGQESSTAQQRSMDRNATGHVCAALLGGGRESLRVCSSSPDFDSSACHHDRKDSSPSAIREDKKGQRENVASRHAALQRQTAHTFRADKLHPIRAEAVCTSCRAAVMGKGSWVEHAEARLPT
jgi:hypothetical protein